jgi:hypothetical protein
VVLTHSTNKLNMNFSDIKNNHSFDSSLVLPNITVVKARIEAVKRIQEDNDCTWREAKLLYRRISPKY